MICILFYADHASTTATTVVDVVVDKTVVLVFHVICDSHIGFELIKLCKS